jgi:putative hydrolase of the HAD superfamily
LLYEAFESTPMNAGMFALARQLRRRHSVGIITDNKKDRIDHLRRHQDLQSLFNPIVVSAEVGVDKGSPEIFIHALRCVGIGPGEAVFIDNNRDNLAAPSALGIGTVFHDDENNDIDALLKSLDALGVHARDA